MLLVIMEVDEGKQGKSVENNNKLSKKPTERVLKLIVDVFKTGFQAFLVGFVITPIIIGKFNIQIFFLGTSICMFCVGVAGVIEWIREGEEA